MKRTLLVLTLSACAAAGAQAAAELKGSPDEVSAYLASQQTHATLYGESEVRVPADRAVVTLKLSTEHKSFKEASQAGQQLRESVTTWLKEHGIGAERIQSAKFSSTPRTGSWSDKVKSFKVESQLDVTVTDDKQFQAAASTVDKWSDVTYAGARYEHSEKEAMRLKAIGQACDTAVARKKTYEEKLGVKLAVKRFHEGGEFRPVERERLPESLGVQGGTAPFSAARSRKMTNIGGTEEPTSAFGELVFRARVEIDCALEAR